MARFGRLPFALALVALLTAPCAAAPERLDVTLRGRVLSIALYRPALAPTAVKGTIVMAGGDVGWVGLAVSMAEFLCAQGYIVAGVNVRQYLSAFTSGASHLTPADVANDFAAIAATLRARDLVRQPLLVSGVSEGAALAVLAAAAGANHAWIDGVITMGLPPSAEIAWRWTDFTAWFTKKDADEPSFAPRDYVGAIAPVPLVMIQSTRDEYVTEADYRTLEAAARPPAKLVLIEAGNHRFTDRIAELHREFMSALAWIAGNRTPQRDVHQD
jgi:hypothetical protein